MIIRRFENKRPNQICKLLIRVFLPNLPPNRPPFDTWMGFCTVIGVYVTMVMPPAFAPPRMSFVLLGCCWPAPRGTTIAGNGTAVGATKLLGWLGANPFC